MICIQTQPFSKHFSKIILICQEHFVMYGDMPDSIGIVVCALYNNTRTEFLEVINFLILTSSKLNAMLPWFCVFASKCIFR